MIRTPGAQPRAARRARRVLEAAFCRSRRVPGGLSTNTAARRIRAALEESLRKLIERRIKTAVARAREKRRSWLGNPFRGLEAYEFEHAAIFFGRDAR